MSFDGHPRFGTSFAIRRTLLEAFKHALAGTKTVDDVVALVRSSARTIVAADGTTYVRNDNGMCHYLDEDAIEPLWKGQKFPLEACISGWCMLNGKTAVIPDVFSDGRVPHDVYRPTFVKSLIMVPVDREAPVAAMGSYWKDARSFHDDEVGLIEELAASVNAAMHNCSQVDGSGR